jgi:hypothetical protein
MCRQLTNLGSHRLGTGQSRDWPCFTALEGVDETSQPSAHLGPGRGTCPAPFLLGAEHFAPPIEGNILVGTRLHCHVERELLKASVRLKKLCAVSDLRH